ncbi:sucrose-6-phosphate hydrolase SacC (GH32 family) [Neobacillus ginsengisoli]|uniref:Sucrose-6-phosphate hydrolase SacC (GH32 family) n=1 Tax=Neobacillus ginsengisoli TaxID=904295 RepID=A0ABT9XRW6_9BACI|nr:sucrose-6-phosphate hydrolase SacC (GH32 family) [Neobacillus ginsengisoli]
MYDAFTGTSFEMICEFENFDAKEFGVQFRAGYYEKTIIKYDAVQKKVILDRTFSGESVGDQYGTVRKCFIDASKIKFHLFVDTSSVEIFINDGEEVFTNRIFPKEDSKEIRFFTTGGKALLHATKWDL